MRGGRYFFLPRNYKLGNYRSRKKSLSGGLASPVFGALFADRQTLGEMVNALRRTQFFLLLALAAAGCSGKEEPYKVSARPYLTAQAPLEQRADQIRSAGTQLGWLMTDIGPGEMRGRYNQRNLVLSIAITYTPTAFSIDYLPDASKYLDGSVHWRLNKHVKRLEKAIQQSAAGLRNANETPES